MRPLGCGGPGAPLLVSTGSKLKMSKSGRERAPFMAWHSLAFQKMRNLVQSTAIWCNSDGDCGGIVRTEELGAKPSVLLQATKSDSVQMSHGNYTGGGRRFLISWRGFLLIKQGIGNPVL